MRAFYENDTKRRPPTDRVECKFMVDERIFKTHENEFQLEQATC